MLKYENEKLVGQRIMEFERYGYVRVGMFECDVLWKDCKGKCVWVEEEGLGLFKGVMEIYVSGVGMVRVDMSKENMEKELLKLMSRKGEV
jgi:hypothetical protein